MADVYENGTLQEIGMFRRLTLALGLLAAATAVIGILAARFGITFLSSLSSYKTIALSAALIWIFFGSVLAYQAVKPLHKITRQCILAVLVLIAVVETVEFWSSVQGSHFFIETLFIRAGTAVIGPGSSPTSPVAAFLGVLAAVALVLVILGPGISARFGLIPEMISVLGLAITIFSITFVLSYGYSNPLLYHTQFIPIAFISALAAFFIGVALVTAAGPGGLPARYLIGSATTARLLRVFVPLIIAIVLFENFGVIGLSSLFNVRDAILLSTTVVIFIFITVFVVTWVSKGMGGDLERAERELAEKNENLGAMNEELMAIEEELRQANETLVANERQLVQKNEDLGAMNEELTATQEELRQNLDEMTRTEKILRESEERFRAITEISPVQISIARKSDGQILFTNPAYDQAFGFAPGELLGHKTPDLYAVPAERTEVLKMFSEKGFVENHEVRVRRKDGTLFWVNLSVRAITFLDKGALIATTIDITKRKKAERELQEKNVDLGAAYEEITATQEELRQNIEELSCREQDLSKALAEKEILLSEIHHRVKNNLSAFISLLSLEGTTEETPAGKMLRKDLQNRARSMALIHETLYRTRLYNEVDMGVYLTTLLDQITTSFGTAKPVKTTVKAEGVMLDIPRATPAGLIINELVTNSFKYAFPASFDSLRIRNESSAITVELKLEDGIYTLTATDNGIGLPPGFDPQKTQSLGLKLVTFLARHQLRAEIEVRSGKGTEFVFRFTK